MKETINLPYDVIKRDGTSVAFDSSKITSAISRAFIEQEYPQNKYIRRKIAKLTEYVIMDLKRMSAPYNIEDIQDIVENVLIAEAEPDVAKAYIKYRYKRALERDAKINDKLFARKIDNQNANVDERSFGGRSGEASSIYNKEYALDNLVSKKSKENHLGNRVYIHDLDHYVLGDHNCLTVPIDDLLSRGFNTRQAFVRPAKSISTAFQLLAVLFQLQSLNQFGGVSASHLDWSMVPYVRMSFFKHWKDGYKYILKKGIYKGPINGTYSIDDYPKSRARSYALDMTLRDLEQSVEGMYHNLNTLQSRSGNQLPFTSINYGTCTSTEGRMVIKALLDGCLKGVGYGDTSIFPCGIFQYMKGVNAEPGTPNYDLKRLALKCTINRIYPNYANVDWSGNAGYDIRNPKTYFSTINKPVACSSNVA